MKNFITVAFLLILLPKVIAQNNSYSLYWDSIYPNLEHNYNVAKGRFLQLKIEGTEFDPILELDFLKFSLRHNDTSHFKDHISKMILDHGYRFKRTDTLLYIQNEFNELVVEKRLGNWLIAKSDELYPEWIKNNPQKYEWIIRLEKLRILDQTRVNYYSLYDTCNISKDRLKVLDYELFAQLLMIFKENGNRVLNYFDNGFDSEWHLILVHNFFAADNMFDIWNMILPYVENAYFNNKINDSYFRLFDDLLYRHSGYQYYGLMGDIPVYDEMNLAKRRAKYNFR